MYSHQFWNCNIYPFSHTSSQSHYSRPANLCKLRLARLKTKLSLTQASGSLESRKLTAVVRAALSRACFTDTDMCCYNSNTCNSLFVSFPSSRTVCKLWGHCCWFFLPDAEHLEWQDRRDSPQWSSAQGSGQPSPSPHPQLQQGLAVPGFLTEQSSLLAELLGHAAEPNILLDWHSCLQKYTFSFRVSPSIYYRTTSSNFTVPRAENPVFQHISDVGNTRSPQSITAMQNTLNKMLLTLLLSIYSCSAPTNAAELFHCSGKR